MKNDPLCIKEDVCDMAVCDGVSSCSHAVLKTAVLVQQSTNKPSDEIADYDCGMLNDHGGGNVGWWWGYIRYEIGRCNDYWRSATSHVG
jgi:hypothetical protein